MAVLGCMAGQGPASWLTEMQLEAVLRLRLLLPLKCNRGVHTAGVLRCSGAACKAPARRCAALRVERAMQGCG